MDLILNNQLWTLLNVFKFGSVKIPSVAGRIDEDPSMVGLAARPRNSNSSFRGSCRMSLMPNNCKPNGLARVKLGFR